MAFGQSTIQRVSLIRLLLCACLFGLSTLMLLVRLVLILLYFQTLAPSVVVLGGKDTAKVTYQTSAQYDAECGATTWLGRLAGVRSEPKRHQSKVARFMHF